jgi:hypothetical protein
MFFATFNIVSVIYHTCAIGRGIQDALFLCHFQYCFSHLPHLCYRLGVQETHVFATFNNVSVIYHSINVGRGLGADVLCLFQ